MKKFLDYELQEDDLEKQVRTWDKFEDCPRGEQDIEEFSSNFDLRLRMSLKTVLEENRILRNSCQTLIELIRKLLQHHLS